MGNNTKREIRIMKILWLGINSGNSGYDEAGKNYLRAIDKVGLDVVYRHINLGPNPSDYSGLEHLMTKDQIGCDVLIQHSLPSNFETDRRFSRNVGLFAWETDSICQSWVKKCNLMTEIWVINQQQRKACFDSGVTVPVRVVPHTFDINKYFQKYKSDNPIITQLQKNTNFKFYTIGEFVRRKNYTALLKAFHTEFDPAERVDLVIKTSRDGLSPEQCKEHVQKYCEEIRAGMKLYGNNIGPYRKEIIITDRLNENDLFCLHQTCNSFVSPSYGEAWCAQKNTVINCENSYKKIQDILPGDYVFNHKGYLDLVTKVFQRNYSDYMIAIKPATTTENFIFTPEHKHYIVPKNNRRFSEIQLFPIFIEAKNIKKGDLWVIPKIKKHVTFQQELKISDFINVKVDNDGYIICPHSYKNKQNTLTQLAKKFKCSYQHISKILNNKSLDTKFNKKIKEYLKINNICLTPKTKIPNKIKLTPDFLFFIGHFIAEGYAGKNKFILSTHQNEVYGRKISSNAIKQAFGLIGKNISPKNSRCVNLYFCNSIISKFLRKLCGNRALNKKIPYDLKNHYNVGYILKGIFYGDGSFSGQKYSFSTSSRNLLKDLSEILNTHNIHMRFEKRKGHKKWICGYNCIVRDNWILSCLTQHESRFYEFIKPVKYNKECKPCRNTSQTLFKEDEKNFYIPIKKVEQKYYRGKVFNFSVEQEQSYTSYGFATHNCMPAWEACAFNKYPIVTDCTGFREYINNQTGYLVSARKEPVFGVIESSPELYSGKENWWSIDILELRKTMRKVYNRMGLHKPSALSSLIQFDYVNIGNKIKELLNK